MRAEESSRSVNEGGTSQREMPDVVATDFHSVTNNECSLASR
jgi:hypothetical protein